MLNLWLLMLATATTLTPINEEQLPTIIQGHPNHIVLVNFWATWCIPCREEFLDLVRLYQERQAEGLIVISISIDDPENKNQARVFLEKHHTKFPAYIATPDNFKAFLGAMDPTWTGAIPATFIFNRQGKKSYSHIGRLSYQEITTQLEGVR